jgi:hypothetical protein
MNRFLTLKNQTITFGVTKIFRRRNLSLSRHLIVTKMRSKLLRKQYQKSIYNQSK